MIKMAQADNQLQLTQARRACYNLHASAFLEPPGTNLIDALSSEEMGSLLGSVFGEATASLFHDTALNERDLASFYLEIGQDYQDLFNVPGDKYVAPYEAVFRDERDVGGKRVKGLLFGPSTDDVIRFYHVAGMEVSPEFLELPDHIGLEFHFMAYLCQQELDAREGNNRELVEKIRQTQWGFLDRHLGQWIRDFSDKVQERASTSFYRGLGKLAAGFVEQDLAALTMSRGHQDA